MPIGTLDPSEIQLPSIYVNRIVKALHAKPIGVFKAIDVKDSGDGSMYAK